MREDCRCGHPESAHPDGLDCDACDCDEFVTEEEYEDYLGKLAKKRLEFLEKHFRGREFNSKTKSADVVKHRSHYQVFLFTRPDMCGEQIEREFPKEDFGSLIDCLIEHFESSAA